MILGKKSNTSQGYVWAPYIPVTTTTVVQSGSSSSSRYSVKPISSRYYSTIVVKTIQEIRIDKIDKIFKLKNPSI